MESEEIEQLLGGSAPQAGDPVEVEAHPPLSEVERALREMREQMDAAVLLAETAAPVSPSAAVASASVVREEASTEAIANLGLDIARLVDVMDCGFDRIEAAHARQTLELRGEVAQMFDELASRMDKFERQSTDPGAAAAEDPSQAVATGELDQPAPVVDAGAVGQPDDGAGEADAWSPSAASGVPVADVGDPPQEASAAADPDSELFDEPPEPASSVGAGPHAAATADPFDGLAWAQSALPAPPAAEDAGQAWKAADDPDSDLFDRPAELAGDDARGSAIDDARAGPTDRPTSDAPEPVAEDRSASEVWFGSWKHETRGEPAPDWRAAEQEPITVTGFHPLERLAGQAANLAQDGGAKRARFAWLRLRPDGQSRKTA
ncbi:MAG TPA: hypothetical protein VHS81_04060 [Caulobacteraceae bacterium]|nr:hypothetical protein [Caulobacteraceae bacterium]